MLTNYQNGKALDYKSRDSGLDPQDDRRSNLFEAGIDIMGGEIRNFNFRPDLGFFFTKVNDKCRLGLGCSCSWYLYAESSTWFSEA